MSPRDIDAARDLRSSIVTIQQGEDGLSAVLEAVGDARVVLLGEATHGTHEFYRMRADITAALVEQKGFSVVAVEADWPDAYRVNRRPRRLHAVSPMDLAQRGDRRLPHLAAAPQRCQGS